jgi:hypothetical protein
VKEKNDSVVMRPMKLKMYQFDIKN